jgi:hypothetical protein
MNLLKNIRKESNAKLSGLGACPPSTPTRGTASTPFSAGVSPNEKNPLQRRVGKEFGLNRVDSFAKIMALQFYKGRKIGIKLGSIDSNAKSDPIEKCVSENYKYWIASAKKFLSTFKF